MALTEEIKELLSYKLNDYKNDAALFLRLNTVYRNFNRSSLCCLEQVESALIQLSNHVKKIENQNNTITMANQFILKADSLLYSERNHKYYVPSTITDDDALELLAGNKLYAKYFETLPVEWEKLVEEYTSQAPKKKKKATKVEENAAPAQEVTVEAEETDTSEASSEELEPTTVENSATGTKKKKKK